MKRLLTEPLLHFLLAGGLLFAAYGWVNQGEETDRQVVRIGAAEVEWLKATWSRQRVRTPDEQELRGLVAAYLKEQLLAREARELGLDTDDTVVRRRLAQKMDFLVQDAASLAEPGEPELHRLYERTRERYRSSARVSFTQVFFRDEAGAARTLEDLKSVEMDEVGDTSLLARDYVQADEQALASVFGPGFFAALLDLESGSWQGPIPSSYGFHLVRISEREQSRPLPFDDVRVEVLEDWQRTAQDKAKKEYFAGLLEKYDVVLDDKVAVLVGPLSEVVP